MRPTIGLVPVVACLLLAVLLGAWGWQDRDEARARARAERADREAREQMIEIDDDDGFGMRWIDACAQLSLVAALTPPSTLPPLMGSTTLAVSGDDLARELIAILDGRPDAGVPPLEGSSVQNALADVRTALTEAIDRSDDPLSDADVVAAASALDGALIGVC